MNEPTVSPLDYAAAGVDTQAGDRAVELMRAAVQATHDSRVVQGAGGFAGLLDVSELRGYRRPLLASSTDGVGTKVALAWRLGVHDTVGIDLVAMVVDDLVVCGARPLAMTDYIACGKVEPGRIADIVRGIAAGCQATGTALVGGETAEHPGLLGPDEYDIAGAAVGVVEADQMLGAHRVQPGDVVVGLASSGLHSNGYSLVRAIVERAGWDLEDHAPQLGRTLGEELLEPTRLYTQMCLEMAADPACELRALSHVTGGGLAANAARVLPPACDAVIDRGTWEVPAVFGLLGRAGGLTDTAREQTWNMGVGMVAIAGASGAMRVIETALRRGCRAWVIGNVTEPASLDASLAAGQRAEITQGTKGVVGGRVALVGTYRG